MITSVGIIGYGSWGLTLANLLAGRNIHTVVWGRNPQRVKELKETREDARRLPGVRLHPGIGFTSEFGDLDGLDTLLFVVPSHALREVATKVNNEINVPKLVLSGIKGIELTTLKRMTEILSEVLKVKYPAVLSGPSIALEVSRGLPTSVVVASHSIDIAKEFQQLLHTKRFRVYISEDVIGVELGGAFKNIIALAGGMVDGLRLGVNAKGALLTRGIVEIMRLAVKMGGNPLTLSGLSGFGDVITTSFSAFSRNRYVGEELGRGRPLKEILKGMIMVAEGIKTTKAALKLAEKYNVDMPITKVVNDILEGKITPIEAMERLMSRTGKPEYDFLDHPRQS